MLKILLSLILVMGQSSKDLQCGNFDIEDYNCKITYKKVSLNKARLTYHISCTRKPGEPRLEVLTRNPR